MEWVTSGQKSSVTLPFPQSPEYFFSAFSRFLLLLIKPEANRTFFSVQRQMAPNIHFPLLPFCYRRPSRNRSFQRVPSPQLEMFFQPPLQSGVSTFWWTDREQKWRVSLRRPQLLFWEITSGGLLDLWFSLINFLIILSIYCDSPEAVPLEQFHFQCVLLCSFINFSLVMSVSSFVSLFFTSFQSSVILSLSSLLITFQKTLFECLNGYCLSNPRAHSKPEISLRGGENRSMGSHFSLGETE